MKRQAPLGIEFISVFGLAPAAFAELAAQLGCEYISTALAPFPNSPERHPPWSLRDDAPLRREFKAAMAANGVALSLGEGFLIRPGAPIAQAQADLDLMAELGAPQVNVVNLEPDRARAIAELAAFAELAAARGMKALVEFLPGLPIGTLGEAAAAVRAAGRPDLSLVIDAMHVFRSGASVADLAALDPPLVGHVQLCDTLRAGSGSDYADEARFERLPPGEGELPLRDALGVLPEGVIVGLEIPMRSKALAGVGPRERLEPCVAATRALFSGLDQDKPA